MEAVKALMVRELSRLTTSKSWLVMTIVQPAAYVALFAAGLSKQLDQVMFEGQALSYLMFALPGILALQTYQLFHLFVSLASLDRRVGVFSLIMLSGTSPSAYVAAGVLVNGVVAGLQALLVLGLGLLLSPGLPAVKPLGDVAFRIGTALVAWGASVILWSSAGLLLGLRIQKEEKRDLLWALLNLPLIFSSSAFYDVRKAPAFLAFLSYANPLTHCSDALRFAMYGDVQGALWRAGLLVGLGAAALGLCLWAVRRLPLVHPQW